MQDFKLFERIKMDQGASKNKLRCIDLTKFARRRIPDEYILIGLLVMYRVQEGNNSSAS